MPVYKMQNILHKSFAFCTLSLSHFSAFALFKVVVDIWNYRSVNISVCKMCMSVLKVSDRLSSSNSKAALN